MLGFSPMNKRERCSIGSIRSKGWGSKAGSVCVSENTNTIKSKNKKIFLGI
jgi:hypothetical protein